MLLCDDHVLFAESFAAMLAALGHEVAGTVPVPPPRQVEARHVAAQHVAPRLALSREPDAWQSVRADVCVVDPGAADLATVRDGLHLLDAITAAGAAGGEPCPLVVLTAEENRSAAHLRTLLDARIRGVVSKRRGITTIVEALTVVQRGGSYFDPELVQRALRGRHAAPTAADQLTRRELEVLGWLVHGAATDDMACAMGISTATVRSHIKAVLAKLGVGSRLQAAARAIALGLVEPPLG